MKKEKIKKWQEELRNPDNKQTKRLLGKVNADGSFSYCCLGLYCHKIEEIVPVIATYDFDFDCEALNFDFNDRTLPEAVAERENVNPAVLLYYANGMPLRDRSGAGFLSLTILNDQGFTFSQIADMLDYFNVG